MECSDTHQNKFRVEYTNFTQYSIKKSVIFHYLLVDFCEKVIEICYIKAITKLHNFPIIHNFGTSQT